MKILSLLTTAWLIGVAACDEKNCAADTGEDTVFAAEATMPNNFNKTTVVVIGCGPGGLFFLHALASKRKKYMEEGDTEALKAMPDVTVYEKNAVAGGNWRPNTETERSGSKDMFGGVWANSISHDSEFFDYTYDQHFETKSVPVFMPRAHHFDYMMARVTSVEDIFQHVEFNTKVTWVEYNDKIAKFIVTTKNKLTGKNNISLYDKCVWAGGNLSKLRYPKSTRLALEAGDYRGTVAHSENIADFTSSIKGKRILLVGDNYSAEDITLQAIKMGVEHVYITSATGDGLAANTNWPRNRATALECLPTEVIHNETGLNCSQVEFDDVRDDYFPVHDGEYWELEDIALVLYCTGYETEMGYLDKELQYKCGKKEKFSVPDGWKSNRNSMTSYVGEVEPSASVGSFTSCDNLYRHVLVANPNMMYMYGVTVYPLPEIDAMAWALAAYVAGETILPTYVEMAMRNQLDKLDEMSIPIIRKSLDDNYAEATMQFESDSNHWLGAWNYSAAHKRYLKEEIGHSLRKIARDQIAGGHGGEWGSYDKLSARGERLVEMYINFLKVYFTNTIPAPENVTEWQTFHDADHTPYESLYTGIKADPLKGRWMDLGDDGELWRDPNLESDAPASVLLTVSQRAAPLLSSVKYYWSCIRTSIG